MKKLNIDRINAKAPYKVSEDDKQLVFETIRSASTTIEGQGFFAAIIVENCNPLLTDITADFDQTAVSLTNKPSE